MFDNEKDERIVLIHLHSGTKGKLPESKGIELGEIAVNYNNEAPFITFKTEGGASRFVTTVVAVTGTTDGTARIENGVLYLPNVPQDVYDMIVEDEKAISGILCELNDKKEERENKVTELSEENTDEQYPSAKAVYDAITENEEIVATALNDLESRKEDKTNKITEFTEDVTDEQYPSAKAVYDAIAENEEIVATALNDLESRKEDKTNKITEFTEDVTDEQYPSAKLVYDKIVEVEEIAAAGMAQLDRDIKALEQTVTDDEEVTSTALNKLNDEKENVSNKVTELSEDNTDDQYPSAKAVVTEMIKNERTIAAAINKLHNEKEARKNKITDFAELENDEQYPSAYLVKTTLSTLDNKVDESVSAFTQEIDYINRTKADVSYVEGNYYKKSQVYTKSETESKILELKGVELVPVTVLPTANAGTMGKIYLLPSEDPREEDVKEEYITIHEGENYYWEHIGSTKVNLENYYTKDETYSKGEVDGIADTKVDKEEGKSLMTDDERYKLEDVYFVQGPIGMPIMQPALAKEVYDELLPLINTGEGDFYPKLILANINNEYQPISISKSGDTIEIRFVSQGKSHSGEESFEYHYGFVTKEEGGQFEKSGIPFSGDLDAFEKKENLVTVISAESEDTQYPSAKAVYDAIAEDERVLVELGLTKEDKSNKVTELSSASTDTQYPSAKAVYDVIVDDEEAISAALNDLNLGKQDKLISGESIKTINGETLLGSGNIEIQGGTGEETDPIFTASPAYGITSENIEDWNGKSDFSGNYEDLSGKPDLTVYQITENLTTELTSGSTDAQYPSAKVVFDTLKEIEEVVATSLNDLETRKENISNKVTELSSGATDEEYPSAKAVYDKIAEEGAAITSLATGKQDKLVSGESIKTINGETLLGSGNIEIQGETGIRYIITGFLPEASSETTDKFYLIIDAVSRINDKCKEYITIFDEDSGTYRWEQIGLSYHDLDEFQKKNMLVTVLDSGSTDEQYPSAKVVYDSLKEKQAKLVSGTNIKTINGNTILGRGNIVIEGSGTSINVVNDLTSTSATDALSANMGRELNSYITGLQTTITELTGRITALENRLNDMFKVTPEEE